ncbi:MAG: hypothetical protein C0502_06325 [Opitutus sp.]|nr:hypothetical protein [Opitutus sp.]
MNFLRATLAALLLLALAGCSRGPAAIRYGQDACAHCRMTLVDQRYGAELITPKGKILVFDDLGCLLAYQRQSPAANPARESVYVADFAHAGRLLPAADALFLHDAQLRSPMGSSLAAFATEADRASARQQLGGASRLLRWPELPRSP